MPLLKSWGGGNYELDDGPEIISQQAFTPKIQLRSSPSNTTKRMISEEMDVSDY